MKRISFAIAMGVMTILPVAVACSTPSEQTTPQTSPNTQTQPNNQATPDGGMDPNNTQGTPGAGGMEMGAGEPTRNATNSPDSPFMMAAAQGGMAEVQLSQLALERSNNEQVRQFAQQMVQDHTPVNEQLMGLFQQKSVTPPASVGAKYGAMQEQLQALSDEEFDREYMARMVESHQDDVANFQREIEMGKDPDAQAFASATLPAIEQHLQEAQTIYQGLPAGANTP